MSDHRETIIALRARREALKVTNDLTHATRRDPPVAALAPPEFFPFGDDVLAECARYREGVVALSDVRIALWKWVQAIERAQPRSSIEGEVRAIITHLENVELHTLANPKLERQAAIGKAEAKIREMREKRTATAAGG